MFIQEASMVLEQTMSLGQLLGQGKPVNITSKDRREDERPPVARVQLMGHVLPINSSNKIPPSPCQKPTVHLTPKRPVSEATTLNLESIHSCQYILAPSKILSFPP